MNLNGSSSFYINIMKKYMTIMYDENEGNADRRKSYDISETFV